MAAEMSTGLLAMAQVYKRKPAVSMLITEMEGKFHKKATNLTTFICTDGKAIKESILSALATGKATETKAHSAGKNESGEIVAEFWFTWSFKMRKV